MSAMQSCACVGRCSSSSMIRRGWRHSSESMNAPETTCPQRLLPGLTHKHSMVRLVLWGKMHGAQTWFPELLRMFRRLDICGHNGDYAFSRKRWSWRTRFIPLRITETHADASPMPDCHVNESEKSDADHIRLLPPKTNEAFVVGLQSEEGQKLNGDHGPITDHHVNKVTGDYRCSVLFEETGVTKRIQRRHLKTFPGVVQTNAFQVDDVDGHDCHALFSLASRFNHSCVPNAGFLPLRTGSQKTHKKRDDQSSACDGHLVLVAIGKICVGKEITLDYLGPQDDKSGNSMQNVRNRRSRLARRYNFVCSCELCTLQDTNSTSPG
ncbi:unnamed protein product [Polarella glacialis]|uniref:SET domain-containing protein n=1 Tax=Polarella glacialis TaxID=89957 RepID=A0A813G5Z3_POLGL|nr:unnamed protein product [Polarella glacialis]